MTKQTTESFTYTATGKKFLFDSFTAADIRLDDIVLHLSKICRFGGAVSTFYSVLEHSLHCEEIVIYNAGKDKTRMRLLALLHDAHEAYVGDVVSPLKHYMGDWLTDICKRLDAAIYESMGMTGPTEEEKKYIKKVDTQALLMEARVLMPLDGYVAMKKRVKEENVPFVPKIIFRPIAESIIKYRTKLICLLEYLG